jgi:hypothetical protein
MENLPNNMDKWVELLTGLVILVGVILVAWLSSAYSWTLLGKDLNFLHAAWIFLKGGIFWLVFMIGALFVLLGLNDLRE